MKSFNLIMPTFAFLYYLSVLLLLFITFLYLSLPQIDFAYTNLPYINLPMAWLAKKFVPINGKNIYLRMLSREIDQRIKRRYK